MQLPYTPAIAISEAVTTRRMSFLICGAQKSGTSALHDYLRRHPGIDLPVVKELHIFDNESSIGVMPKSIGSIKPRPAISRPQNRAAVAAKPPP